MILHQSKGKEEIGYAVSSMVSRFLNFVSPLVVRFYSASCPQESVMKQLVMEDRCVKLELEHDAKNTRIEKLLSQLEYLKTDHEKEREELEESVQREQRKVLAYQEKAADCERLLLKEHRQRLLMVEEMMDYRTYCCGSAKPSAKT